VKFEVVRDEILRRWRQLIVAGVFLIGAYAAVGFLLVPYFARYAIEKYVTEDLKRQVSIGKITFNPFTFTSEIRNFALTEANNAPIASFDFFRINFQISSILYRAWTFREVRLDRPDIQMIIDSDGSLNLGKLKAQPPPAPAGRAVVKPFHVPSLRIFTLSVHEGRFGFEDRSSTRKSPFTATLKPIEFTLTNFRTDPDYENAYNFEGTTLAGERLAWTGQFTVQPTGSTGSFEISNLKSSTIAAYLGDALGFDLTSGFLDLKGGYRVALDDKLHFSIDLPAMKLRELGIAPAKSDAAAEPWIRLPLVEVSNSTFSFDDRKIHIGSVSIDRPSLDVWREMDGSVNLSKLGGDQPATSLPATSGKPAVFFDGWNFDIGTIAIQSASVNAEDRMMAPPFKPVKLAFNPVQLTISNFSNVPGNVSMADADITAVEKGRLAAKGTFTLAPMAAKADIDITDLELPPLEPYIVGTRPLQLTGGQLSAKGSLQVTDEPAKGQPGTMFAGEVTIANLATIDNELKLDFLKWKSLRLAGLRYTEGPDRLDIERVEALQPYGRFLISPEHGLNVVRVLSARNSDQSASPKTPMMPVVIRTVVVRDGTSDFRDFSVDPNFSAAIYSLNGSVTGLSSDRNSRAEVMLTGSVDRYSPVDISGQVNLLSAALYCNMAIKFRNMELTTFNPYSGKYAGYSIRKGKLTTELQYKVENRKLNAEHHIVLDQLEFGAATDSKEKVPLPIKLAAALLKDRHGVIDVNVPVSGSIDDPTFRLAPLIWKAFKGLLDRIVTAPFKLIGALFGKGDDLEYVEFRAGSATITPDQEDKIATLAKGMVERPEIRLDIPLRALTSADDTALAKNAFDAALAPLLPQSAPGEPPTSEQRLAALTQLYQQQMGTAPEYPAPPAADADVVSTNIKFLEDALRPRFTVTASQRDQLARGRADAVQAAVLSNMQVEPERVFLAERESGKSPISDTVRMELRLE
jgi:hypothetical protein